MKTSPGGQSRQGKKRGQTIRKGDVVIPEERAAQHKQVVPASNYSAGFVTVVMGLGAGESSMFVRPLEASATTAFPWKAGGILTSSAIEELTAQNAAKPIPLREYHSAPARPSQPVSVQDMVDDTPIQRPDELREKLQRRAVEQILGGTTWLTASQVGKLANPDAKNEHALAGRLLKDERVFAIQRRRQKEFPRYEFDALGQPVEAVRKVLEIFSGYTSLRVASWFESTSSALNGRRPREVLADDPNAVVAAALQHVHGPLDG